MTGLTNRPAAAPEVAGPANRLGGAARTGRGRRSDDEDREERRAERQAAREEHRAKLERCREERRDERESLREERQALAAQQLAALNAGGRSQYRIGLALKDFRSFDGTTGSDGAAYLLELTHLLGTHEIPAAMWPRELSLKLTGKAANWYASRFPGLHSGTFPPWGDLYAAMLLAYSHLCQQPWLTRTSTAPPAFRAPPARRPLIGWASSRCFSAGRGSTNPATRNNRPTFFRTSWPRTSWQPRSCLAGSPWPTLTRRSPTAPQTTWSSSDASAGRNSCPPQTREAFFAVRGEHVRNFLRDQGHS